MVGLLTRPDTSVLGNLKASMRGNAACIGVQYCDYLTLLSIALDMLPVPETFQPMATDENRRLEYTTSLIRTYREQAWKMVGVPMPSIIVYQSNGEFPVTYIDKIVDAGGSFWRYLPGMERTGNVYADMIREKAKGRVQPPTVTIPKHLNTESYAFQDQVRPQKMSTEELDLQRRLAPYRDDSFSIAPEALESLIFGHSKRD